MSDEAMEVILSVCILFEIVQVVGGRMYVVVEVNGPFGIWLEGEGPRPEGAVTAVAQGCH
jgi:hypothetical protein